MKKINIIIENYNEILEIAHISKSKHNLIKNLGWTAGIHKVKEINMFLEETNFDIKIFEINKLKDIKCVYSDKEKLINVVKLSNSFSDVLRTYNKKTGSGNFVILHKYIDYYRINTSHFDAGKNYLKENYKHKISTSDILVKNSKVATKTIKSRILKESLLEYKCITKGCGNIGEWFGKKVSLQLDHINGVNNDHRLENLQFLCPNCHCATPTWGNKRGSYKPIIKSSKLSILFEYKKIELFNKIAEFNSLIDVFTYLDVDKKAKNYHEIKTLLNLYIANENVNIFLSKLKNKEGKFAKYEMKDLISKLKNKSLLQVSKELNCSDNGLRKHLLKNGIDPKSIRSINSAK